MKTPIETRPNITNTNIRDGFVTRYFTQLVSTKKIYEIDNTQYDIFVNNPYYITIKLSWTISGNINTDIINGHRQLGLLDKNKETVDYYNQTMPGLNRKLRNPGEYNFGKNNETDKYNTMVTNTTDGYIPITTEPSATPEPTPSIVTDGLYLHYDMGDIVSYPGSGSTWFELTGFNAPNNNAVEFDVVQNLYGGTGEVFYNPADGGSWEFTGAGDPGLQASIGLPGYTYTSNPTTITFSFWAKVNAGLTGPATLLGTSAGFDASDLGRLQIRYDAAYRIEVAKSFIASAGVFTGYTATPGAITNITVTKSGTTYSLYINGVYISQFTSELTYNPSSIVLGQSWLRTVNSSIRAREKMKGNIYIFMVYDRALSAAEILQNYNARKGRYGL